MPVIDNDLWSLTAGQPEIDPTELAAAIARQAASDVLDFRTRLLIRDSVNALSHRWGPQRVAQWLAGRPESRRISAILDENLGPAGFPSLASRLMEQTRPETVLQFLRELGSQTRRPTRVSIGGAVSLILSGRLSRHTEDIDVVDEVPADLREQYDLLDRLTRRYGLHLTHFQSHFLPAGWAGRVQSLGEFGNLQIDLVDSQDVFLGKLFSSREKDRDDLRVLAPGLDRATLAARFLRDTAALRSQTNLRETADLNWRVLYGEPLPQ